MLEVGVGGLAVFAEVETFVLILLIDAKTEDGLDDGGEDKGEDEGEGGVGQSAYDLFPEKVLGVGAEKADGDGAPDAADSVH